MKRIVAAALVAGLTASAHAVDYGRVQPEKSRIDFTYQQMGVKVDGHFRKFVSRLSFDPARPAAASAEFEVELASIDLGSAEADQEAAGKPWFDTRAFPTARFVAESVKPLGGERLEVAGKLTIKGRTQPLVVPAHVAVGGDSVVFDGAFTLRRGDFGVGEGAWAKFDVVANDVVIKFRITSTRN